MSSQFIQIRGARQHNLKGVDLDLPKGKLTVITGPSGCGKSSLAFHTLFAEGQRRYLECLGNSARKVLKSLDKPDYDFIEGLSPTVALEQGEIKAPRGTTVGMMAELHDYLRLLYSTIGEPHDPNTGEQLERLTAAEIVTRICALPERSKVILLAPLKVTELESVEYLKDDLRRQGFMRVCIKGQLHELEDDWELSDELSVVVDRLMVREGAESRLADSLEIALQINSAGAGALVQAPEESSWSELSFTTGYHNPVTGFHLPKLEARSFAYTTTSSHCVDCHGSGRIEESDCPTCGGERLQPAFLHVRLPNSTSENLGIAQLTALTVGEIQSYLSTLVIPEVLTTVIDEIRAQLNKRLHFLTEVGLDYLQLDQWASELSAGEYQRLRLASQLGAGLSGVLYVLDEPSRGLHHRDTTRLIKALYHLRDLGNTVVIVEHEPTVILAADWLVDMGPGAGESGGEIRATGTLAEIQANPDSPTGRWLVESTPAIVEPTTKDTERSISISEATLHNLKSVSVEIPVGALTTVEGPSGCGKSSLITKTLAPYALFQLNRAAPFVPQAEITGLEAFQRAVVVDQSPIGRSPRSSPATYTGLFDHIRSLFASLPLSKQRGYQASRFSFNVKGGRCEKCLGSGKIKVELQFLNDAYVTCDSCHGARYNRETLEVRYKGKNISEILNSSVQENHDFFAANPNLAPTLSCLNSVGLGYLRLGQGAHTLSGGEAQRVKIATELQKASAKRGMQESTLYLLDEPTRGLHFMDIEVLTTALRSLLVGDNTIVVIEHNQQFLASADHRIKMGEGGGMHGGRVLP